MSKFTTRLFAAVFAAGIVSAGWAATNERISATFQSRDGAAGVILREQDKGNHYEVRLRGNKLEFVKTVQQAEQVLGSAPIPADMAYRPGQQWKITAAASGNMISGQLVNADGIEVTSGTVFDRAFTDGASKLNEANGTEWGQPSVQTLPEYETAPDKLSDSYDVVIAGAGTGGSIAAIQAARLGSRVLVIEETDWIGGQMAAAAVTSMDEGAEYPPHGITRHGVRERGLYREFYNLATHLYGTMGISTDTCYITENHFALEPATAQGLLYEMFQQERAAGAVLDVTLETSVTRVLKSGDTVTGVELLIHTPEGPVSRKVSSRILIDATEYGDILPLAGVPYRIGNWTSDNINLAAEKLPAIQDYTWTAVIETYPDGAPEKLMMKVPPKGYDKSEFQTALDHPEPTSSTKPWSWQRFIGYRGMPDSDSPNRGEVIKNPFADVTKTHMNIGANDAHIDVSHVENLEARLHAEYELKLATLKLLYYIQNDMTEPMTTWTIALDEGFDTPFNREQNARLIERYPDLAPYKDLLNQFPPMAYARESRRMIGVHTIRAAEIDRRTGPMIFPTSVAVGDYAVDLHGADSPSVLEPGLDAPGDLGAIGFAGNQLGPFTIPFEAFIPEKMNGFLAAEKNISQSRLVNGATRLQPSTMLMGQAAGAIAGLAVAKGVEPRELHPAEVQMALLDAGDTLFAAKYDAHKLPGVALDTELYKSLQLCLLYGVVHLGDAHQHLGGLEILSGETGSSGWQVSAKGDLLFAGDTTGLAVYEGQLPASSSATSATDYTVSASFVRTSGNGTVGVVGRLTDSANFYHARLMGNKLELYKWDAGKPTLLESAPVDYKNGSEWTISMQFDGNRVSAALSDAQNNQRKEITVTDASHAAGSAGLRVQPGAGNSAEFAALVIQPAGGDVRRAYKVEFRKPVNFNTDTLTRGQFAIHLARYLGLGNKAADSASYPDMKPGNSAFAAVEALRAAGIDFGVKAAGQNFTPGQPITKGDIALALATALKLPLNEAPADPVFSDVPASHPAFAHIQALAQKGIGMNSLLEGKGAFSPASELTMADSLHLFADLIVNPPAGAVNTVAETTAAREAQ